MDRTRKYSYWVRVFQEVDLLSQELCPKQNKIKSLRETKEASETSECQQREPFPAVLWEQLAQSLNLCSKTGDIHVIVREYFILCRKRAAIVK